MMRVDSIRHEARKEAWKNDSYNPFRKTIGKVPLNRSNTMDLEAGDAVQDSNKLRAIQTEPAPRSPSAEFNDHAEPDAKPVEEYEMTKPNGPSGRSSAP